MKLTDYLESRIAAAAARVFTRRNLTQGSSLKAYVGFALGLGILRLTPDQQQQAQDIVMRLIADLTNLIGDGQLALAFINLVKDDHKAVAPAAAAVYAPAPNPSTEAPHE